MPNKLTNWLLVAALVVLGYVAWKLGDLSKSIQAETAATTPEEKPVQTMTSKWTSNNTEHTLSTTKNAGETDAQWMARHATTLAAAQTEFPPDDD